MPKIGAKKSLEEKLARASDEGSVRENRGRSAARKEMDRMLKGEW